MNEKNVRSIPELFGSMVFSQAQMRQRLPERVYDAWQQCLIQGTSLDRSIADEIAAAMKDWAIEKGATDVAFTVLDALGYLDDAQIRQHRMAGRRGN